jgi:hypothetical protein
MGKHWKSAVTTVCNILVTTLDGNTYLILIAIMKTIPVCNCCGLPLRMRGKYAKFRCLCDEDIRTIVLNDPIKSENVEYLIVSEHQKSLSDLFIKGFLTSSSELVK